MTRRRYAVATAIAASVFAVSFVAVAIVHPRPRLVWNASASAPIGLYRIQPDRDPPTGALVAAMPPAGLARWLAGRGYLPAGLPLLKHIAAKAGQRICRHGAVVSIDARPIVIARAHDGRGRPLPVWRGCHTLQAGELLLLNPAVPDSLDGRYFGPLPASAVIGRALPLHLSAPPRRLHPSTPRRPTMPVNIFEPTDNGYAGRIRLFAIDEAIMLVPAEPSDAGDPADYRIHLDDADGPIVGFARKRTSERAGDYIAMEIESPLFARWFKPKLFRTDAEGRTFRLSWRHPRSSQGRS